MFKFSDVLGTLMQSGISGSTSSRMQHALGAGGSASSGSLAGSILGGGGGSVKGAKADGEIDAAEIQRILGKTVGL